MNVDITKVNEVIANLRDDVTNFVQAYKLTKEKNDKTTNQIASRLNELIIAYNKTTETVANLETNVK